MSINDQTAFAKGADHGEDATLQSQAAGQSQPPAAALPSPAGIAEDKLTVQYLLDQQTPEHTATWTGVSRLVRSIIQKQLFAPVNDQSIDDDDLLQVALSEIAISLRRFDYRCRLNTWLHQITIYSLRRGYRDRNAQRRKGGTVPLPDTVIDTRNALAEEARWHSLVQEILCFLAEQPDQRLAMIFYQRFVEEQRLGDIGRRLNLSPARIHALLRALCQLLQQHPSIREQAAVVGVQLDGDDELE